MLLVGLTGRRNVGKTTAANILVEEYNFDRAHPFDGGKEMCVTYYERLGIEKAIALRMVNGDLKDTPNPLMPGGVSSRYLMERFGKFMGVSMGYDWTLGVEIKRLRQLKKNIIVESIVYEADYLKQQGGVIIRLERDGVSVEGGESDSFQANVKEDFTVLNNGTKEELKKSLSYILNSL